MPVPDISKTPRQQLVEAINHQYRRRLTESGVKFGVVKLLAPTVLNVNDPTARNSTVEISNADDEPYEFTTVLHFNRLPLDRLFVGRDRAFAGAVTHSHDLVPALTARLGIPVSAEDIVGHDIDTSSGYPFNMLLVAAETSLLLFGQISITLTGP